MKIPYKSDRMADGIYLVGTHSDLKVGTWVLESGGECAVMEMPMATKGEPEPALQVKQFLDDNGWICKYLLLSHPHLDHCASIHEYRNIFPAADFSVHYSVPLFLRISERYWGQNRGGPKPDLDANAWDKMKKGRGRQWYLSFFNKVLTDDVNTMTLGNEPLYMVYGPKHSLADIHHIFKGVWFPGDWWLGEGDPCIDRAAASKAAESIGQIKSLCKDKNYSVHSIFPSHANNILRNVDFFAVLDKTSAYHERFEKENPDELDWKDFCIKSFYYYTFREEFGRR